VIKVKGSYLDAKMDMLGASLYRLDPASDELQYNIGKYDYHHKQTAFDVNAQGKFDLLGRTHELSIGGNYRRNINDDGPGGWPSEFPYQFDPFNWQQSVDVPMPEFNYMWERQSKEINYGLYGTAKLNVTDPLNVFVGGRLSWYETNTFFRSGTYTEATAFDAEHEFTPYVAATYDLNDVFTVYGSVTSIFKPQNYTGSNGALLNPVTGTNYEAGIKGEFLGGRLNASLAAFQIDQKNLPDQLPPCDGGIECYSAAGKVRSRGFEAEVSGLITEDWRVFAGYTYINAKYLENSTGGKAGDRYGRDKPQHLLTLSTVYTLPGDLNGWRVGASGRFQSAIEGNVNGYVNAKQDAFGLLDLMVAYSPTENTDFRLNVYNVFDKYYYKGVGYTDNANLIGAPRSFTVTGTYKF
jgi:outer membrane receptor for ferric coprogen and ferric-rhodotorulic acid